jgi:hypothetical protein
LNHLVGACKSFFGGDTSFHFEFVSLFVPLLILFVMFP